MSDSGHPPAPTYQPVPQPPSGRASDIPLWVMLLALVLMVAGVGTVAAAMLVLPGEDEEKKSYPKEWDARIAPYVKVVEKERELNFMHPVEVRFLAGEEFEKEVTADESELDQEDREEIEQFTGLYRALGMITGDVDLFKAFNDARGSGTLAYYSFENEEIVIRGTRLTRAVHATLVHELTHALQDQHFAIGDRKKRLAKEAEEGVDSTEYSVFDSIVEGDAERVATLYRESLTARQRQALAKAESKDTEQATKELAGVPKVVRSIISSPYVLGESMLGMVVASGGNDAVDELYRDTPTHDAALLDPFAVLADEIGVQRVDAPDLAKGEDEFTSGEFGAISLYFMLAERLPLSDALSAADAWDGDAYVAYEHSGRSCARATFAGHDQDDTDLIRRALRRWTSAAPGSPARVTSSGGHVLFESCDPGKSARVGKDASIDALRLVNVRNQLGSGFLQAGAPAEVARCVTTKAVRTFPMSTLTAAEISAADQDRLRELVLSCR